MLPQPFLQEQRTLFLRRGLHLPPQAQWSHIRPDLLNVGQAFFLCSAFARVSPAWGILSINGPDRILFFVVDDNPVDWSVFPLTTIHVFPLFKLKSLLLLIQLLRCVVFVNFITFHPHLNSPRSSPYLMHSVLPRSS
jgi:hypothetical protein